MPIKVLNLYAGIGGNRRLWPQDVEVTAIELNESIAAIYKDLYPNDNVICADAHSYLLENIRSDFDFIWSSPPCPTHSQLGLLNFNLGQKLKYPDMKLYQEILVLSNFFKGKYVVENVKPYYMPLIPAQESGRHCFWANFKIGKLEIKSSAQIKNKKGLNYLERMRLSGIEIKNFHGYKKDKRTLFKNCVEPELGKYIFNCALGIITKSNTKQLSFL